MLFLQIKTIKLKFKGVKQLAQSNCDSSMMQETTPVYYSQDGALSQTSHYFTKYILLDYHFIQLDTSQNNPKFNQESEEVIKLRGKET